MSPLHLKSGVDLHCTFNMIVKSLLINLSHSFCKKMFVNLVSSFRVNVDNVTEFDYWNSILAHSLCLFQSQNLYKKKKPNCKQMQKPNLESKAMFEGTFTKRKFTYQVFLVFSLAIWFSFFFFWLFCFFIVGSCLKNILVHISFSAINHYQHRYPTNKKVKKLKKKSNESTSKAIACI